MKRQPAVTEALAQVELELDLPATEADTWRTNPDRYDHSLHAAWPVTDDPRGIFDRGGPPGRWEPGRYRRIVRGGALMNRPDMDDLTRERDGQTSYGRPRPGAPAATSGSSPSRTMTSSWSTSTPPGATSRATTTRRAYRRGRSRRERG